MHWISGLIVSIGVMVSSIFGGHNQVATNNVPLSASGSVQVAQNHSENNNTQSSSTSVIGQNSSSKIVAIVKPPVKVSVPVNAFAQDPNSNPNMSNGTSVCPIGQIWHVSSCLPVNPTSYYTSNSNMGGGLGTTTQQLPVPAPTPVQPQIPQSAPVPAPTPSAKVATYLNIISPNGGEFIAPGSTYNITWSTDSTYPIGVEIKRLDPNSTVNNIMPLTITGSGGSYTWNVPVNDSNYPLNAKYKAAVYEIAPTTAFVSQRESDSNNYFYLGDNTIIPVVTGNTGAMPLRYSSDGSYATQDFYFTVKASNAPIYVSTNPSLTVHLTSNIQGTADSITAQNPAFADGDTSSAWVIPAGNQRIFKITIKMQDNTMGLIKLSNGSVRADQFYYSLSPNITSTTGENSVSVNVITNY